MIKKVEYYLCGILILGAIGSFFLTGGSVRADGLLHVYFLDVGQGDAILIKSPSGAKILIDGGPNGAVIGELAATMPANDKKIDTVISTHTDADHLSGLIDVLKQYDVANIIETGMYCDTKTCSEWEQEKNSEMANDIIAKRGINFKFENDLSFEILNPEERVEGVKLSKTNNGSIVLKMTYKNRTALFMADVDSSIEQKLLKTLPENYLDVDVLKVGHHGSKYSSGQNFLNEVSPVLAFIEVGEKNSYGHPSQQTLDRLDKIDGLSYYRTDIDGRVELASDGEKFIIKKYGK